MDLDLMTSLAEDEPTPYFGKTPKKVSGTRAKLQSKRLLKNPHQTAGKMKSRATKTKSNIVRRQTMPSKLYRKTVVPPAQKKARFIQKGESLTSLCFAVRELLDST